MKFLLCVLLMGCYYTNAQTSTMSVGDDFRLMSGYTAGNNTGYNVIPTYNPIEIKGNPFYSEDWLKGSVTTIDNNTFTNGLLFMYNKYNNELYYKKNGSDTTLKIDLSRVASFTLIKVELHNFIRADIYDKKYAGEFFEALALNEKKYSFFKLTKTILQDPPYSQVAQVAANDRAKTFIDKKQYFIYYNGQLSEVDLKKKSFQKLLGTNPTFEKYLKDNGGSFNEAYVMLMFNTINEE